MESSAEILTMYYLKLPFSKSLKRFMNLNGFLTLEKMLQLPAHRLLEMKGFNMHSMKELYQFLEDNKLEHELKTSCCF